MPRIHLDAKNVIPSRFPVTMVRRRTGGSIPLGSGMGSSRHREAIVDSTLGPIQKETELLKIGRKRGRGEVLKSSRAMGENDGDGVLPR